MTLATATLAQCRGFTWTPDGSREPTLRDIDLAIAPGERVLLAGASGSGKSTLLRALAGLLHVGAGGEGSGEVHLRGEPAERAAARVGLLVQDPRDARVAATVGRDVAFGCENAAMPRAGIWSAVRAALRAVRFPYGTQHAAGALSGGEAQRLALAGVIALRPDLLLLDEPTSMLDAASAAAVRQAVAEAIGGTDTALVVVEHRLRDWLPLVDRMIVLADSGRLVADGAVDAVLSERGEELARAGVWVPGAPDPEPLVVPPDLLRPVAGVPGGNGDEATASATASEGGSAREGVAVPSRGDCLRAWDLRLEMAPPLRFTGVATPAQAPRVALDGVDAVVTSGRLLALCGGSGAGKSSLIAALCGLVAPTGGRVRAADALAAGLIDEPHRWRSRELAARIGWVPQDASANVVGTTVRDCLLATVRALEGGVGRADGPAASTGTLSALELAERIAQVLGLTHLMHRHPLQLSGGEARRLAVAAGMLHGPPVLCLDEPTVGQDRNTWAAVVGLVLAARAAGTAVVVSTHDEALAALADERLDLADGRVVA